MNPKVSIIILNWNGWEDTIECLESLYQIAYPNYDAIVVDNGSEDESIQKIKEYSEGKIEVESKFFEYFRDNKPIKIIEYTREEAEAGGGKEKEIADLLSNRKLIIIKNEKNYGFAEGNNIAMRYALKALNPDYVLLLNNDTVVDKEFLNQLVKVAESDERIGIVGPKIYYYDDPEIIQTIGVNINFWSGNTISLGYKKTDDDIGLNSEIFIVDYVYGACFLIKREVMTAIGLLDPDLFLYGEEIDWSLRAKINGYKSICCLDTQIWHKSQASSSKNLNFSVYYPTRNRILLLRRYATKFQILFSIPYFIMFNFIVIVHNKGFKLNYMKCFFKGIVEGLVRPC